MNRIDLILRARSLVRDLSNSFFRENDLINYINEGIERVGQVIPELNIIPPLLNRTDEVQYLPNGYQHLLAVYCASRLCTQDERHYQAGTFMNEFETKLATLAMDMLNGDVIITDAEGKPVDINRPFDHVRNNYFFVKGSVRQYKEDVEMVGDENAN